jgi:hypothetical protein
MKYTYIASLLILSFALSGCFTKPAEEINTTPEAPEVVVEIDQPEIVSPEGEENQAEEPTETQETQTQESEEETSEETSEATETQNKPAEEEQDEQVVIEEYEQELEALFNDILGE